VFEHDVERDAARVRESIGVVFQAPSVDKKLTVRENLLHQGHLYGLAGASVKTRIDDLLVRFGLSDRASDKVGDLSGGLARRVEVAKGMIHKPRLLLLDEPSTGLDPAARRELAEQLADVRDNDGTTILLTTHILEEADECDRLAILDQGHKVCEGSPGELKSAIPGDVVTVDAPETKRLAVDIAAALDVSGKTIGAGIRFEARDGDGLAVAIRDKFAGRITSLTIGRPSLEDVFLAHTGHAFRIDTETGETT
jgi:ABC-2 type transport system ATP-binding protein